MLKRHRVGENWFPRGYFKISTWRIKNSSEESNETSEESNETSEESNETSEEFFDAHVEIWDFPRGYSRKEGIGRISP